MTHSMVLTLILLPLLACGAPEKSGGESTAAGGAAAKADAKADAPTEKNETADGPRFDKETMSKTCELLTVDMVAQAFEVPADSLEQRGGNRTYCRYEWGDNNTAAIWHVNVGKSAEDAAKRFDGEYQDMSGAQVAAAMGEIKKQVDEQDAKGELEADGKKVNAERAKGVANAVGGALSAGFEYEPVEGIGDKAVWNKTKRVHKISSTEITSFDNKLIVLLSNANFQIEVQLDGKDQTKDEAMALAQLVIAALP